MASLPPLLPAAAPLHRRSARFLRRIVQGLHLHNAAGAAPAMAFHFFLSLVPVLVLVGFVLGRVVRQRGVDAILGPAIEATPDAAEQIVRAELERLAGAGAASSLAPLSVVIFVWLAAGGVHGLMDELEVIAGAPHRSWWHQRALAHAWVLGALFAVAVVAWGMLRVDAAAHRAARASASPADVASAGADVGMNPAPSAAPSRPASSASSSPRHGASRPGEASPPRRDHVRARIPILQEDWEKSAVVLVLAVFGLVGLAAFYRLAVAHPRGVRRRVWPGALVAFAAWLAVSWAFGAYVGSLGRYTLYYGSVAAVAVLLVWLYLTSWSLLLGAELNAQLEGLRG